MANTHTTVRDGRRLLWRVERLWELARDLEPFEIELERIAELDRDCWFDGVAPTVREVAAHAARIRDADLSRPIVLNAEGGLMDGGHRVCRALIEGRATVLAVRFEVTPEPDEVLDEGG